MTRGQREKENYTEVGGDAAPGFFDRIRQREKLEDDARTFMRGEQDARRMIRSAYRKAVRRGEYAPDILFARNSMNEQRDNRNEDYKTGMRSDFDATMAFLSDYQDANKEKPSPFSAELAGMTSELEGFRKAGDIAAAEELRKQQIEELEKGKKTEKATFEDSDPNEWKLWKD